MKSVNKFVTAVVRNPWIGATVTSLNPPICNAMSRKESLILLLTGIYEGHVRLLQAEQPVVSRQKPGLGRVSPCKIALSASLTRETHPITALILHDGGTEPEAFGELIPRSRVA
ncbi:MAG TPA: hypothetical protein VJ464_02030 [Blastocatellia bacterium]|nr:hypothetical protein [Blastocatellia bacterium]